MSRTTTPFMTMPPVHPAAELFPFIGDDELDELAKDIAEHDLHEPIVLTPDGQLLDGRNRWRACELAGVDPSEHTRIETSEPWAFVISANLHRRHLTVGQRGAIGADYATRTRGGSDKISLNGQICPLTTIKDEPSTVDQAAELLGVSPRTIKGAKQVKETNPEVHELVRKGTISAGMGRQIVAQPEEKQREIVTKIREGTLPRTVIPRAKPQQPKPQQPKATPEPVADPAPDEPGAGAGRSVVSDLPAWLGGFTEDEQERAREIARGLVERYDRRFAVAVYFALGEATIK